MRFSLLDFIHRMFRQSVNKISSAKPLEPFCALT